MVAIGAADAPAGGAVARHAPVPLLDVGVPTDDPGALAAADTLPPHPDDVAAAPPPLPSATDPRLLAVPAITPPPVNSAAGLAVPILMYHFIRVARPADGRLGYRLSVTPADLAAQLALLRRDGFTSVTLGQVTDAMNGKLTLPERPVVLTFDDGYLDFAVTAAPLLAAAGFHATDFVVSGFVGHPGYMSAAQVRDVVGMGMTIGAHTIHHIDLATAPAAVAETEITGSREDVQSLTGQPVTDFAYPSGRFTPATLRLVAQAGFKDAVTTVYGTIEEPGLRLTMPRLRVDGGQTLAEFADMLRAQVGAGAGAAPAHGPPRHAGPTSTPRAGPPSRRP